MRVIAGSARRIQLKTAEGMNTRPTTDRIKETLFNIISDRLYGCSFLDLFSGSGAIGIEALSRGAERAVFVDKNRSAAECIRYNLSSTHLADRADVLLMDCRSAVTRLAGSKSHFDIVFMDPPYRKMLEADILDALKSSPVIDHDTLIIIEASLDSDFDYLGSYGYELLRTKKYKTNKHLFVRRT